MCVCSCKLYRASCDRWVRLRCTYWWFCNFFGWCFVYAVCRLSWLLVSFLLHVKYTLSYRICLAFLGKDAASDWMWVLPTEEKKLLIYIYIVCSTDVDHCHAEIVQRLFYLQRWQSVITHVDVTSKLAHPALWVSVCLCWCAIKKLHTHSYVQTYSYCLSCDLPCSFELYTPSVYKRHWSS